MLPFQRQTIKLLQGHFLVGKVCPRANEAHPAYKPGSSQTTVAPATSQRTFETGGVHIPTPVLFWQPMSSETNLYRVELDRVVLGTTTFTSSTRFHAPIFLDSPMMLSARNIVCKKPGHWRVALLFCTAQLASIPHNSMALHSRSHEVFGLV